ncbi:MAG: hypothetical protein IPL59_18110 [Candidatus Competibacteraceae bacterium]|nr:hypothetical protein [Candidatus Competibacteraceae bacterium]
MAYVLSGRQLTIAQLMRKVIASKPDLFGAYDGNQVLADRLVASFGSEPCPEKSDELHRRMENAFIALTGVSLSSPTEINCGPNEIFSLQADTRFWVSQFLPIMSEYPSQAHIIPIEKDWAVVADLFDPAPGTWGLREIYFFG